MPGDVSAAIAALRPISLGELDENAGLLARVDRKYLVDRASLPDLVASRSDAVCVLEIDGRRSFSYESVYFDTPELDSYHTTAHRRRRRFKVRSRLYRDSGLCVLEVKVKGTRGRTVKHRIDYDEDRRWVIADHVRDEVDELCGRPGVSDELEPFMTTRYDRTTLVDTETWSRATIDVDLVCADMAGNSVSLDDWAIVETKSAGSKSDLDEWLWRNRIRPSKISKFCVGAAALHPELPSNKWHRTLVTYFDVGDRSGSAVSTARSADL